MSALHNTLAQIWCIPSKVAEYTFFLSVHGTFTRTEHILHQKRSLNKFKKTEIIPGIFLTRVE